MDCFRHSFVNDWFQGTINADTSIDSAFAEPHVVIAKQLHREATPEKMSKGGLGQVDLNSLQGNDEICQVFQSATVSRSDLFQARG